MAVSSLVLWAQCPGAQAGIKCRTGFVTMTGPAALKTLPIKNPPAQPSGFENFFSALAVFVLRPQAEHQIGAGIV